MPLHIPPGPLRMRPWKPLWNCSNPSFPQRKQNTEPVHLRPRTANKQADTKSTRSDGPTGHTLSNSPKLGQKTELLTFEAFQLFSQVFLIPVFLVFQIFLREKTKKKRLKQDSPIAIKEESSPKSNRINPIVIIIRLTVLINVLCPGTSQVISVFIK